MKFKDGYPYRGFDEPEPVDFPECSWESFLEIHKSYNMKTINRELFYAGMAKFRPLSQRQVNAMNFLLDKLDASEIIKDLREYAYILATVWHETDGTCEPITERGSQAYLRGKRYYPYIGRGYVQLTWSTNYRLFSDILGIDLVNNPQLANEPETAWKVLEIGMSNGLFTGKKLSNYFNDSTSGMDLTKQFSGYRKWTGYLVTPRRIINGTDRYRLIGDYALTLYNALNFQ